MQCAEIEAGAVVGDQRAADLDDEALRLFKLSLITGLTCVRRLLRIRRFRAPARPVQCAP
jgi:hypothetical protein